MRVASSPLAVQPGSPQQIAGSLFGKGTGFLQGGLWPRIRPASQKYAYVLVLQQSSDAKHMVGITDGDAAVHMIFPHDRGHAFRGFSSIRSLRFGNQRGFGNSLAHQVVMTDSALAELGVRGGPSSGDDKWGKSSPEKFVCVVQSGSKYRRGAAIVLCGARHDDGVSGMKLLFCGVSQNGNRSRAEDRQENGYGNNSGPEQPVA